MSNPRTRFCLVVTGILVASAWILPIHAQSIRMSDLPGFARVQDARSAFGKIRGGQISNVHWSTDNGMLYFSGPAGRQQLDLASGLVSAAENEPERTESPDDSGRRRLSTAARARQRTSITSPDGKWKAQYADFNIQLQPLDETGKADGAAIVVTVDGTEKHRFGTACWVYGEELYQQDAMWFSPDSNKLAFYEIDESHMKTYYLTGQNTGLYTTLNKEQYPKAGEDNPHVQLHIYDIESGETVSVAVDGPADQYIYGIEFSPNGEELIFHRTNRLQNKLDILAANVATGTVRTIVTETQETWQENSPLMRFLEDGQRFVWETEKTGWKQFELRHIDGRLIKTLTADADYPVHQIVRIDEAADWLYYTAFSDENRLNQQLHRCQLDGNDAVESSRLTPGGFYYSGFEIAPDHQSFVASFETVSDPPAVAAFDMQGNRICLLAEADTSALESQNLTPGELFSFPAADGQATLYGRLFLPRNFDPDRQYPLLIDVYGGPHSVGVTNRFSAGNPYCELGFAIASIGNRGTMNLGKAFESATYQQLGILDLDDQAAGVRFLTERPYLDGSRVGIFGHSYGGYLSALALLRYPDVFHVGVAGAPVTDWKNYDTIYTERYMRTPQENPDGYAAGSCIQHADKLTGKLFLLHGLVDDNVHPSNTWQLVEALQKAGKRFDLMVYPNSAHGFPYNELKWEYLIRHLQPAPVDSSQP